MSQAPGPRLRDRLLIIGVPLGMILLVILALASPSGEAGQAESERQSVLGWPLCFASEVNLMVLGDGNTTDVAAWNMGDCAVSGVTVVLNGEYRCNMGLVRHKGEGEDEAPIVSRMKYDCLARDGERFDAFTRGVTSCRVEIDRPRIRDDCGIVGG